MLLGNLFHRLFRWLIRRWFQARGDQFRWHRTILLGIPLAEQFSFEILLLPVIELAIVLAPLIVHAPDFVVLKSDLRSLECSSKIWIHSSDSSNIDGSSLALTLALAAPLEIALGSFGTLALPVVAFTLTLALRTFAVPALQTFPLALHLERVQDFPLVEVF
jgi:hypothetical protein